MTAIENGGVQGDAKLLQNSDDEREALAWAKAEEYARDTPPSHRMETMDDFVTGWLTADRTPSRQGPITDAQVEAAALAYAGDEMSAEEWEWVKTQPEIVQPYLDGMRAALEAARGA